MLFECISGQPLPIVAQLAFQDLHFLTYSISCMLMCSQIESQFCPDQFNYNFSVGRPLSMFDLRSAFLGRLCPELRKINFALLSESANECTENKKRCRKIVFLRRSYGNGHRDKFVIYYIESVSNFEGHQLKGASNARMELTRRVRQLTRHLS